MNDPDEIQKLKDIIQELKSQKEILQETTKKLESEKVILHETAKKLEFEVIHLKEQLTALTFELYGPSSEKIKSGEKPEVFNEAESVPVDANVPDAVIVVKSYSRKSAGRKPIAASIPRHESFHDISDEDKKCACGKMMKKIGEDRKEDLIIIPQKIEVEVHIYPKYACVPDCIAAEGIHPAVKKAPPIPTIIEKSMATASLLAYIIVSKFCDALPFYRLEKIFLRIGVKLKRATMCNWTGRVHEKVKPMIDLLKKKLLLSFVIGIDETTVQVLNEPDKKPQTKSWMWVFRGGSPENPIILFHYDPGRGHTVPEEYLKGYHGRIQSDGLTVYDALVKKTDFIHIGCWSHARRRFYKVYKATGKRKDGVAYAALERIWGLYAIEREIKNLTRRERTKIRQEKSVPILLDLKNYLEKTLPEVPPEHDIGGAIKYTLKEWEKLMRYTDDGNIPIDNNGVENAIRPFAVGRNNWLFNSTQDGAEASSAMYSLIETAKANGIEPHSYLNYIFEQIPLCKSEADYEKLLPMNIDRTKIMPYEIPVGRG